MPDGVASDEWAEKSMEALNEGDISTLQKQLQALPPELLAQAVQTAHDMGNAAFKDKNYNEAIYQYTSTIAGDYNRISAYSNRAACYVATKHWVEALKDAKMCVQLKPEWPKSYYRLGRALHGVGGDKAGEAVEAFAKGVALDPKNKEMRKWHKLANTDWLAHLKQVSQKPPRVFDSKEFDKLVKKHEEEERAIEDHYMEEERVKAMQFEKPDGTAMSTEEMERMLGGLPDPKDRGDAFRATFDSTSALKSIGRTKATKKAEKKAGFDFGSELVDDGGLLRAAVVEPIAMLDQDRPGFLPSEGFSGCRRGYHFKAGKLGNGYYRDDYAGPPAWVNAVEAELEPPPEKCATCERKGVRVNSYYRGKVGQCYCCGLEWDHDVAGPEPEPEPETIDKSAVRALRSYMQDVSELSLPLWNIDALKDARLQHTFAEGIVGLHASQPDNAKWLHLGTGTCVALMKTLSLTGGGQGATAAAAAAGEADLRAVLDRIGLAQHYPLFQAEELTDVLVLRKMAGRVEDLRDALKEIGVSKIGQRERIIAALKELNAAATPPEINVSAITAHDAPYLFSAAHRVLAQNNLRGGVNLIHRRIETVRCTAAVDLGLSEARRGSAIEEARRAQLPAKADICVLDPELLDEGLIGKRVLHQLAHARRELLAPNAVIMPAAATIHAVLLHVRVPKDLAVGFDLAKLDRYRWAPCYEKFVLKSQPEHTCKHFTEPTQVLRFDWQTMSPEQLESGGAAESRVTPLHSGSVNAVLFWFQLHTTADTDPADATGNNPENRNSAWGQALQWLTPPVGVTKGEDMLLKVNHSSTRIVFELTEVPVEVEPEPEQEEEGEKLPVFNWKRNFRIQRTDGEEEDEYYLQLAHTGILFFDTTDARGFHSQYLIEELIRWSWSKDEDGDSFLHLTMRADRRKVEVEVSIAENVCQFLTQKYQWNDMVKKGLVDPADQPNDEEDEEDEEAAEQAATDEEPAHIQGMLARWHFDMVADKQRNQAYDGALRSQLAKVIAKRKREETKAWYADPNKAALAPTAKGALVEVLDIGCGSGLLAMMAARAAESLGEGPAVHITGVDTSDHLINTAAEIVTANGHGRPMTLVKKDSRQCSVGEPLGGRTPELQQRADVLVLELFDYGLLGEGLLPVLHHAFSVLLKKDAIVIPAVASLHACLYQQRSETCEGFNVELHNTYRYHPEYTGKNMAEEIALGHATALSGPFKLFEFDLAEYVQPHTTTREQRLEALAKCAAEAHADYDPEAADPDNLWGSMKSEIGIDALHYGDNAFKDGEMIDAFMAYSKGAQMEPINKPMQSRLTAVKRFLGFPLPEDMHLPVKITQTGVLNSVVFWFELQMEKPDKPDEKERSGVEDEEEDEEDDDGAGVGMPAASPEQASPDPANLPCCASCCQAKPKAEYSKNQWSKKEARRCKSCVGLGVADPSQTDATEEPVAKATAAAAVADPAVVLSTGPENPILGTHWLQACQYFEEISVTAGEAIPVVGMHDGISRVNFAINRTDVVSPEFNDRRTSVPPIDPLWMRSHQECNEKMKKIQEMVVASKEGHRQAAEGAATIAIDPGQGGNESIDPQKANLFALGFHG